MQVQILLSTYNGKAFLESLLESLFQQTFSDWQLLVRDDGSQDGTQNILHQWQSQNPQKILLFEDEEGNLGPTMSFGKILEKAEASYLMFCDQDDLWFPMKIADSMKKMEEMEKAFGKDTPLLVHTDLKIANAEGEILSPSFYGYQRMNPHFSQLSRMVIQNATIGCTQLFNRALQRISTPISSKAVMHDWWIGLVASAFGKIGFLPKATLAYRQHSANAEGARNWNLSFLISQFLRLSRQEIRQKLLPTKIQAAAFLECFQERLSPSQKKLLEEYIRLFDQPFFRKRWLLWKYGFWKHGFFRNLGIFWGI